MSALLNTTRRLWLTRLTGAAALLLVGATWPLWLPPTPDSFPQLPLFAWLIPAPAWCDRAALGGLLLGAAGMIRGGSSKTQEPENPTTDASRDDSRPRPLVLEVLDFGASRLAPALFTASLAAAVALNQIRLQVWAYQFLLLGGVLSLCPRTDAGDRAAVTLARVLAVGVLFHSALSKLDLAFAEGPGRWLIGGFLGLFGADADALDPDLVAAAAFAVPAWELGLSVLLAVPSLRRAGLAGAVLMHVSVTATLWALDQSWGVILWNLFFLAHEFALFWPEAKGERVPLLSVLKTAGPRAWPAAGLIVAAVLFPFGTRAGYWDVWPGWAVYAGGVPRLEATLYEPHWHRATLSYRSEPVPLGSHALRRLRAPLPQDPRVRLGVLSALSRRGGFSPAGEGMPNALGMKMAVRPMRSWRAGYWRLGHRIVPPGPRFEPPDPPPAPPPRQWGEPAPGFEPSDAAPMLDTFLLNARPRTLSLPPDAR